MPAHAAASPRVLSLALTVSAAAGVSAAAWGQTTTTRTDDPVLKGPAVKDRDVPGVPSAFGTGTGVRRMAERIPPEVLREALGALLGDDAAPEVRADETLARQIRGIEQEFRAAQRAYMAEHREEMIELRRDANLAGRGAQELDRAIGRPRQGEAPRDRRRNADAAMDGGPSPMMGEASDERQAAARQRLREILEGAPRIEDFATRVWDSLSPAQRAAVEARLDEWRAAEAKRREEAYVRQRALERERNSAAQPESAQRPARRSQADAEGETMPRRPQAANGQAPERPNVAAAQRRERLMRMFERLSPEQQENLLQRLENALRDGTLPGAPGRGRPSRPLPADAGKPAPSMDGVEVPDPSQID